ERITGIDSILNSIKACEQHCRERNVWVCRWIGCAELNPLRLWPGGVSRNTHGSGTIACCIGQIHRRLESPHEALESVGAWLCRAGERGRVFRDRADEKESHL